MTPAVVVVELIGSPFPGSRTRALADAVVEALAARTVVTVGDRRVLELSGIVGVSFGAEPAVGSAPMADPFTTLGSGRLLVVATPTFKGTYTGLLKVFLDQLEYRALTGVVAVPVATAASLTHLPAVASALTALLVELGATVPMPALAVLSPDVTAPETAVAQWADRHGPAITEALNREPDTTSPPGPRPRHPRSASRRHLQAVDPVEPPPHATTEAQTSTAATVAVWPSGLVERR